MAHPGFSLHRGVPPGVLGTLAVCLVACGDNSTASSAAAAAPTNSGQPATQSVSLTLSSVPVAMPGSEPVATPFFHLAPVILDEPADTDVGDASASGTLSPHEQSVTARLAQLSTRRLTREAMDSVIYDGVVPGEFNQSNRDATPLAAGTAVATYTPAQIRAAYGLPVLPAAGAAITSAQAAQFGAGQTIYLIDAQDDPNSAAELATFNQKFGLPGCATTTLAPTAALPLAAAPTTGCTFSVVHSTASGAMTAITPTYESGWATEIALDVQWSHATAPQARIILIEAPDASLNSLVGAVELANSMGPGIVSMSFGAAEGNWTGSLDSSFGAAAMTYLGAAGDSGAGVEWPAVSSHVLAVGGSTLTYSGSGARSEAVWSGTGGGISQYVAAPGYQTGAVPGVGAWGYRSVSDVSMNADPTTGQYVVVIAPGSTASWVSAGGTSLATPQWAGIIAVADAERAQGSLAPLGQPHTQLYHLAAQATVYASDLYDITHGSDGSCGDCYAGAGYDAPSGLGTPNAAALLAELTAAPAATAPVVAAATVTGTTGVPLSFAPAVTAADAVTYTLSGAPAGMSIAATGLVSWANPLAGTYAVTVTATDSVSRLSGHGVYTVAVTAPKAPVVAGGSLAGTAGAALTDTVTVTAADAVTFSLSGAPSGMTISAAGVLGWPTPVAGSYAVTVTAKDTSTGLSGSAVLSVSIAAPKPPLLTALSVSGTAGRALAFAVAVTAADPLSFTLAGAPAGMLISATGSVTWANPVAGKYSVTLVATDTRTGLAGSAVATVTIVAAGPVITASTLVGVAGKPLAGSIVLSDSTANSLNISISGIPAGMTFTPSGLSLAVQWTKPVTGKYTLNVSVTDGNGARASLAVPVTITAT